MAFVYGGRPRFKHQKLGLKRIVDTNGVCALLMDPGCGKTATALDYMSLLAYRAPREVKVLVACPLVAVDSWVEQAMEYVSPNVDVWAEALGGSRMEKAESIAARGGRPYTRPLAGRKWSKSHQMDRPLLAHFQKSISFAWRRNGVVYSSPLDGIGKPAQEKKLKIIVVNLEAFSSRARVTASKTVADVMIQAIERYAPDLVLVDESHKIKKASGNTSRVFARISSKVKKRIILTGTVMPHSPLDVYAQWRFLEPYAFGVKRNGEKKEATLTGFTDRYAERGGYMGREIVSFKNLDEMQDIMARNSIVVRKEDALDLPKVHDVTIPVRLSPVEQKAYQDMVNDLAVQLDTGESVVVENRLTQMLRLRQITSGQIPDGNGGLKVLGDSKLRTISSLVNDTLEGEDRVVVFAFFRDEPEKLKKMLEVPGTEVLTITGGTKDTERIEIRKRFGSKEKKRLILVAQISTISLAVNELVSARHVVFATLSQKRDDYIQGRDRLHRLGQTRPVTVWHVVAPRTVDEVILKSHRDRTNLEASMLKHIKERASK